MNILCCLRVKAHIEPIQGYYLSTNLLGTFWVCDAPLVDPYSHAITNFFSFNWSYLILLQGIYKQKKQATELKHFMAFQWFLLVPEHFRAGRGSGMRASHLQTKRKLTSCLWWLDDGLGSRTPLPQVSACPQFARETGGLQHFPACFGSWPTLCLCIVSVCLRLCFSSLGKGPQALLFSLRQHLVHTVQVWCKCW